MVMATDLLPGCGVAGRHRSWDWSSLRGRSVTGHDFRQYEGRACFYQAIVVGPGPVPTPCASRQIGTRAPPERTGGPESSRVIPTQEVRHQPCQPAPGQPPRTLTESSIPAAGIELSAMGWGGLLEDRAAGGRLHELGGLAQHTLGELRSQRAPALLAGLPHGGCDQEDERLVGDVEADPVAIADEGDGAAVDRLGCHVADTQSGGPAGEPAVGEEQDVLAEARALDCAGDREHLAHPRAALGALVADDDDVAGLDGAVLQGVHRGPLALEDAGGALEDVLVEAGRLHDGALGGQ